MSRDSKNPCDMSVEQALVDGLSELRGSLREGERLEKKFTMRTVDLNLQPNRYSPGDVKRTRESLQASQAVLAQLVGVNVKTVQSWDQGLTPPKMACRLLDLLNEDPERWKHLLRGSMRQNSKAGT